MSIDAETILNDLYESEIRASITWVWDSGFHLSLGDPNQARGWAFRRRPVLSHGSVIRAWPTTRTVTFARKYGRCS